MTARKLSKNKTEFGHEKSHLVFKRGLCDIHMQDCFVKVHPHHPSSRLLLNVDCELAKGALKLRKEEKENHHGP
jgi:hypothetical protein